MNHAEQDEPLHGVDMPDRIDLLLRQSGAEIEDAGFTEALLAVLPGRHSSWLRPVILLGSSAVSLVLGCLWLAPKWVPMLPGQVLHPLNPKSLTPWLLLAGIVFPLTLAIGEAFPIWKDEAELDAGAFGNNLNDIP